MNCLFFIFTLVRIRKIKIRQFHTGRLISSQKEQSQTECVHFLFFLVEITTTELVEVKERIRRRQTQCNMYSIITVWKDILVVGNSTVCVSLISQCLTLTIHQHFRSIHGQIHGQYFLIFSRALTPFLLSVTTNYIAGIQN